MKNFNLLSYILGFMTLMLLSATSLKAGLITIKPADPRYVVTYKGYLPQQFVSKWVKKGYVFKHSSGTYGDTFVVMEKY